MKQTLVVAFDDFDWFEEKVRTPADETVVVQLAIELDLTHAHAGLVKSFLDRIKAAGRPIVLDSTSARASRKGKPLTELGKSRAEGKDMQEWAEARGFRYRTPRGHVYYSTGFRAAYAAWLKTGIEPDAGVSAELRWQGHQEEKDHG